MTYSTFDPSVDAIVLILSVTLVALWANPRRRSNVAFTLFSLFVVLWLFSLHLAVTSVSGDAAGLLSVRMTAAIGASFPFSLWLLKEVFTRPEERVRAHLWRAKNWIAAAAVLAMLPFTQGYIPKISTRDHPIHGPLYTVYMVGTVALYVALARQAIVQRRQFTGVQRIELDILLLGGSVTATLVVILMAVANFLRVSMAVRLQPLVIVALYCGIVISMVTRRVFNARQLVMVVTQKLLLGSALVIVAMLGLFFFGATRLPEAIRFAAITTITLIAGGAANRYLNRYFQFYPHESSARKAVLEASKTQSTSAALEAAFISILKGWGQTDHAILLFGQLNANAGELIPGRSGFTDTMRELQWATPERLTRERATAAREAVSAFLNENNLGVLVFAGGSRYGLLLGVGLPTSRSPVTYPQVNQLMELAALMESSLDRAQYSTTAQHAQQLATIGLLGANLAEELRGPISSMRRFLDIFPAHHLDETFCDVSVTPVAAEIARIEKITSQLLDLSQPHIYSARILDVQPIVAGCLDLVRTAAEKRIAFYFDRTPEPQEAYADASALKQVLLNLLFNAIQAAEAASEPRWVKVTTLVSDAHVSMLVEDSGAGIDPAIRAKLFEPFQTTKKGRLGLGLAISHDILANLQGRLCLADGNGRGAVFQIELPRNRQLQYTA